MPLENYYYLVSLLLQTLDSLQIRSKHVFFSSVHVPYTIDMYTNAYLHKYTIDSIPVHAYMHTYVYYIMYMHTYAYVHQCQD